MKTEINPDAYDMLVAAKSALYERASNGSLEMTDERRALYAVIDKIDEAKAIIEAIKTPEPILSATDLFEAGDNILG